MKRCPEIPTSSYQWFINYFLFLVSNFGKTVEKRCQVPFFPVAADAGYDAERAHAFAGETLGIRSIIPNRIGRPTIKLPSGKYSRTIALRFNTKLYGQRWTGRDAQRHVQKTTRLIPASPYLLVADAGDHAPLTRVQCADSVVVRCFLRSRSGTINLKKSPAICGGLVGNIRFATPLISFSFD